MRKSMIFILLLLFFAFTKSNICFCITNNTLNNNTSNQSVITPVVSATKYISIFLCIAYGVKGTKKVIKSAKLLLPTGQGIKIADIVKYPFRLVFEFPFKACDAFRYFAMAGGFGCYAFITHKVGF